MDAERLKRIEEIYHAATEIPPAERVSFLSRICGGDEDLRREVASLLAVSRNSNNIFDTPPESLAAEMFAQREKPSNLAGSEISHYKIIRLLGAGGMGEVYLAEDIKLNRPVALKCLPPEFAEDKERMSRFIREAKSASALNHPNIITIHEINEFEGTHFIATEYIDGETLKVYIKTDPLSLNSALEIAVQIASALDEAHSAGIIHRDVKPDNVMIRPNGLVKILDFGIAKLSSNLGIGNPDFGFQSDPGELPQSNHKNPQATSPGIIIGTANYMSPEQAKGKEIDARTDIFSFGVVLYEMLAGRLPFEGESPLEIMGAILHKEAKALEIHEIPPEIAKIIGKCLRKNRDERYQTIKDVLVALKDAKQNLAAVRNTQQILYSTGNSAPQTDRRQAATGNERRQTTNEIASRRRALKKLPAIVLAVLFVSAVGFFGFRFFTTEKQIKSIAVMPFVNQSGNQEVEYLSDGMTESLIRRLSNIPQLSIKARSTVFTYKGKTTTAKKIGEELNVDAVLFGRLVRRGDDLTVNIELVDTSTEDVLWSENYERRLNRLFSLESEIARNVSENLRLKLTRAEQVQVAKTYTTNSEAQQLYLKGRFHWNKRNKTDFEKAAEYFKQAVEKDPNYALAYTGLASTFALMPLYGNFRPKEYIPQARQAALKALELDANLAEAHASLGYIINTYNFDWDGAEREYKTAIKLNPNYATARQWYAEHLAFRGMADEALIEISKALELDPFSVVINRMKGNILVFAGRYDEAIVQLQKTIELYPENSIVRFNLGEAYAAKRMYSEAVGQYLIGLKLDGQKPEDIGKFEAAFKDNGWKGFWVAYLENLEKQRKTLLETDPTAYFNSEGIAYAFAAAGNKEKALEYLGAAFEERDPNLVTIKTSEVYVFLADDPRFKELIRNIGLPE
jgi:serine/threonine protein kinase/Tfp pilus assembly protein PilF